MHISNLIILLPAFVIIFPNCTLFVESGFILNKKIDWVNQKQLSEFESYFLKNFNEIAAVPQVNFVRNLKQTDWTKDVNSTSDPNFLGDFNLNSIEGDTLVAILEHLYLINKTTNILSWNKTSDLSEFEPTISETQEFSDNAIGFPNNNNSDNDDKFGMFTNYCGPGNWADEDGNIKENYFGNIDNCCKNHDECDDVITKQKDYENYPDLEYKKQYFTRLRCNCDVEFFQCLYNISSYFSNSIVWIYSHVQSNCFEYEYPIVKCTNYEYGFWYNGRCIQYEVDNSRMKKWQWFDLPFTSSDNLSYNYTFPKIKYLYSNLKHLS